MNIIKNFIYLLLATVCSLNSTPQGIDVSHRQGNILWEEVKKDNKNIKFVYVKVTEGATFHDPKYDINIRRASYAKLEVGVYHFFRMTSTPEDQFKNFKSHIACYMDYITLLPVVDVETFDGKTSAQVKSAVETFVKLIYKEYGIFPIIYGPDIAPKRMLSNYVNENCLFFLGQPDLSSPKQKYSIWQYSDKGSVRGIKTQVDLNMLHRTTKLEDILWNK